MATDIATLALKIENGDVVKATTALDSLAVAGGKTEKAAQNLTRRMALLEIAAREMDAEMARGGRAMVALEVEARKLDAELERERRAMALVEIEARKMDAAMSATHAGISTATSLITKLAAAFGAFKVAQFANESVLLAARYETLGVAMEVVGRSAGVNAGRMGALQAEMQKTGISATESRLSLTRLVQAHINLADATKLARIAQDAAVIGNVNSSEALGTLIHGIQSAQTDVLRTIGINVNFENSYKSLAAQLHTTSEALTEQQKTQARVNVVMAAGKDIAGTYEAAMGTVGKQLTSTTRYLEDMRVKVATAFLPEYAASVKAYADSLKFLSDNAPAVIGAVTGITAAVAALGLLLKGSAIVGGLAAIGGAIAAIGASPIIVATAALTALGVVVGSFATDAALARREAAEFSETLKHLPDAALIRNIDRTALAIADLKAEIAQSGAPTKYQSDRLGELTEKLKQYTAARTANAGAKTAGEANAAAAAAEAARAAAAKLAAEAAKQAKKDLEALQKATDDYYNSLNQHQIDAIGAIGTLREQNDATRAMIEATKEGPAAVEALTIAQAGANAVRELGVGVSEKLAASVRKEAEEHARLAIELGHVQGAQRDADAAAKKAADDAERDMERRAKDLHRTLSHGIEGILTDISNRQNPFRSLLENLKRAAIHAIAEAIATKVEGPVGDFLGITTVQGKQAKAAADMNTAADKQLRAAAMMNGSTVGSHDANGIIIRDPDGGGQSSTAKAMFAKAMGVAGAAYGAYQTGYGTGAATQNQGVGAVVGGLSGAAAGFATGGVPGAIVGAFAGIVGGFKGAADAADEAAKQLRQLHEEAHKAATEFHTSIVGDSLDKELASLRSQYTQLITMLLAANGGKYPAGYPRTAVPRGSAVDDFTQAAEDYAKAVRRATENYNRTVQEEGEDFHVRYLRAIGQTAAADAEAFANEQKRERQHLVESFGDVIDANEAATLAQYDQAAAAEKAARALDGLTTSVRFAPSGFKLAGYIQQFATATPLRDPLAGGLPGTFAPNRPISPLAPPSFSQNTTSATPAPVQLTFASGAIQINGTDLTPPEIASAFLTELDRVVGSTGGINTDRVAALKLMKRSPMLRS